MLNLSQEHLFSLLKYDQETGIFTWRFPAGIGGRTPAGSVAGKPNISHGYVLISILGMLFPAHRLAWLYMTGEWPKDQIDHINRIRHDNRWCNLRESSPAENMKNKNTYKSNTSRQAGVTWHKRIEMWQVRISAGTKRMHLGYYDDRDEAAKVYLEAKEMFHSLDKATAKTDD